VALKTGLRQGELLALAWDDIDLVAGRLVVSRNLSRGEITTPKNGKTREIPLGDDVLAALKRHRHLRGDVVFCQEDGSMFTKGETKHPLWRACKRAGLRRIGWHVLAYPCVNGLVVRKADVEKTKRRSPLPSVGERGERRVEYAASIVQFLGLMEGRKIVAPVDHCPVDHCDRLYRRCSVVRSMRDAQPEATARIR
jgi:hypothetical protein